MAYAERTSVSPEKSREEIEKILKRYGATGFAYGWEETSALIAFKLKDRHIRFTLKLPERKQARSQAAWEQSTRQRWRSLALIIKAKLEAVESGIVTIEEEFLAHIILPDNKTVGDWIKPQIEQAYINGNMPKLLGAFKDE